MEKEVEVGICHGAKIVTMISPAVYRNELKELKKRVVLENLILKDKIRSYRTSLQTRLKRAVDGIERGENNFNERDALEYELEEYDEIMGRPQGDDIK